MGFKLHTTDCPVVARARGDLWCDLYMLINIPNSCFAGFLIEWCNIDQLLSRWVPNESSHFEQNEFSQIYISFYFSVSFVGTIKSKN